MKNLKKVLSLVLALAMALSLMTVAFAKDASDYADYDKVTNKEAVSVLTTLEVIDGMGGSFNPTGNVTRAQMAKMITIISLGNVDATAFLGTKTDLKDINGHWAEAYIKYCYSQGIISGRGNGIFDPNANVTSAEASKMLLTAIGYNAGVQGYTGAQWAINVTRDAQLSGFYDGVSVPSNQALTRDEAAQMIYNAVSANTVRKVPSLTVGTNEVSYTYYADDTPLLEKTFDTKEYVGVMDTIAYTDSNKKYSYDGTGDFENKADKTDKHGAAAFITTDDYTDLQGEEVSIIAKTEKNGDETILGIYATGKSVVVTSAVSALDTDGTKLKVNGTSYELENGLTAAGLENTTSYNTVKLVDSDANGKLDTAVTTVITPAKVTYVSSDEIIAGGTTYKFEDDEIPSDLAKGDYVTVVTKTNGVNVITELEPITGKVDGEKSINGTACARVNGTWYAKNSQTMTVDNTYTFYAVNGVVVAGSVDVSTADIANLIMVLDADTSLKVTKAMVMDASGKISTVTIDTDGAVATPDEMYTYTETDNGYKLTVAGNIGTAPNYDYAWTLDGTVASAGSPAKVSTIGGANIADDAVIFVSTNDGGKIITGKQLKNLAGTILGAGTDKIATTASGYYTSTVNGLSRVTYAGVVFNGNTKDLGVTSGNEIYAYVTSDYYTVANNYVSYTIWNGTENLTVIDKDNTHTVVKGDIITYDAIDGDGYIAGVEVATLGTPTVGGTDGVAAVYGIEGDYVYLDGTDPTNKYEITSDTKYLYVDSNADTAEEIGKAGGELSLADKFANDTLYMDNVIVMVNASGELELVVIDVKNNMSNYTNLTFDVTDNNANFSVSITGTNVVKVGDAIEITCDTAGSVTVAGARDTDGNVVTSRSMTAGQKLTVFVTGNGDVTIS